MNDQLPTIPQPHLYSMRKKRYAYFNVIDVLSSTVMNHNLNTLVYPKGDFVSSTLA